jgi:hypothetical protein
MAPGGEKTCFSCDDQRLVRIVPFTQAPAPDQVRRIHHPLMLEKHEWEALLRTVTVRSIHRPLLGPSYQGAAEPAFSEEEVRYLGESLQRAFQQATEQEQVVFAVARSSEAGLAQLTSGAWFVEEGRIHLRLANCRVAVSMPSIKRQIWIDPLFAQAGTFYELVPGERQVLVRPTQDWGNPFRPEPAELAIDYGALTRPGTMSTTLPSEPALPGPHARPLEEQFGQLKRLYEQGLITEEEYRLKRQQLLDRL